MAEGRESSPLGGTLAGVLKSGNDADMGGERFDGAKGGDVATFGHQACRGGGADAVDGGPEFADLVPLEGVAIEVTAHRGADLLIERAYPPTQGRDVLAKQLGLHAVGMRVALADRALGGLHEDRRSLPWQ
ncbi:MAG TPA: hypothetical protein VEK07_08845 [Polyangiaceae bacterium]|nr:hypothetical protein [Polyangiaceae bacterium]